MEPNYATDCRFLEPPHSHDPSNISHIAALPASMLIQLPEAVQDALWALQESTSIVYASYLRLEALLQERFEWLTPLSGPPESCEFEFIYFHLGPHSRLKPTLLYTYYNDIRSRPCSTSNIEHKANNNA